MIESPYIKPKINIDKLSFYILVGCLTILTLLILFWVLIPFSLGSKYLENNELTYEQKTQLAKQLTIIKIVSYIANSLALICFLIYIVFLRHKLKAGYGFLISWMFVFSVLSALPWFRGTKYLWLEEIIVGCFISLVCVIIVFYLVFLAFKLHWTRRIHFYEWFKIHKKGN
ncbi:hypothetical protein [Mycoplasma elephantis]|uniref:hypothetical protein n=1 Tax=Mycoplasma elephantis TaxID=114882 RepID=UPI000487998D|nr:hypothetical protein [Mycoplasma elephantis]